MTVPVSPVLTDYPSARQYLYSLKHHGAKFGIDRMKGFEEFHLLKGPTLEDHTLYATHTVWSTKEDFEAWTKSEEFRAAHARAGNNTTGSLYLDHPKFEGFEVKQTLGPKKAVA